MKEKCEAALLEENRKKNRDQKIYPSMKNIVLLFSVVCGSKFHDLAIVHLFLSAESSRPHLSHIENVANSDYINACYVDVS